MLRAELIADIPCETGEGPLWHPDEGVLYWVDIPGERLYRYHPDSGKIDTFETGAAVGGMTLQADGQLLLFMARGAVRAWHDGAFTETLLASIPGEEDNRFNDVIADPAGRVFCGTMSTADRAGKLYRLDPDATLTPLVDGVGTSNGLGFTADRKTMFHTDTRAHTIYRYAYDEATGNISNRQAFITVRDGPSRPDGMTVDREDGLWSARWDGYVAVRYGPDGGELGRIAFPARKVSCVAFGGADYRDLYVTTAGGDDRDDNGSTAGSLFRVTPGVQGRAEFRSRIGQ